MTATWHLSNVQVLWTSTILFTLFVVAEVIAAYASNSLSLLGDAAAMSVDVFTYGCNLYAETRKEANVNLSPRMKIIAEVGLPFLSVTMLISVTIYVTIEAALILLAKKSNDDVDVVIMYAFATVNFFVDVLCTVLFHIRGRSVFHSSPDSVDRDMLPDDSEDCLSALQPGRSSPTARTAASETVPTKNLNMISAFFHIGGDTLRTIAIFVAALVSTTTQSNADYCDAWAAIVVSITIFFLAVPMLFAIYSHMKTFIQISAADFKFESVMTSSSHHDVHIEMQPVSSKKLFTNDDIDVDTSCSDNISL